MHIAILMTNTDDSAFAQRHPRDGDKFRTLLGTMRPDWKFTVFAVKDNAFPADLASYDGFIITGSPASVHDDQAWVDALLTHIRQIASLGIPMFGACFGHQAIAKALGGTVAPNPGGWVLGLTETVINGKPMQLYAAHNEQVTALPPGAQIVGGNTDCPIGSFAVGSKILTTQYHPEMTHDFVSALVEHLEGVLPDIVIARARASLDQAADTGEITNMMVDFLEKGSLSDR